MTKLEHAAAATTIGLPLAGIILWDTGLMHRWSLGAALLNLTILAACCAAAYLWLRYWRRR